MTRTPGRTPTAADVWRVAKWVPATWLLMLALKAAPKGEHADSLAVALAEWMKRLQRDV